MRAGAADLTAAEARLWSRQARELAVMGVQNLPTQETVLARFDNALGGMLAATDELLAVQEDRETDEAEVTELRTEREQLAASRRES
jgi:hypothetical protein